ncbi:MAG: sodium-dependent transporter [Candidatus Margulisbacteria bacterium]|nr:sodium-dependent transporter [Candidatus Margulisiibacteriota bacterium]
MSEHKKARITWGSQLGFIFAAIGSAIGLGNVWRFSYMTYENGGGAFLIPYLIALLTAGIPLMILEFGLGHKKHGSSSLAFAKISRKFEWLGWWMPTFATFGIMLFYSVVIGWCINYIFYSFTLAWGADAQTFFLEKFLNLTPNVFTLGGLQLPILASVAFVWFITWLICFREVNHGIEKACLIFMPLLFGLTLILIGWGLTLPGALEGIKWYLKPDFSKIMDLKVWIAAYGQIFFTLTLGFGVMIAYASYLPKRTNIIKNALITSLTNCAYSFITGFAVFSVLGYMAAQSGLPIDKVVKSGPTLAFVAFPQAISMLPFMREAFGVIFFGALAIAGISSGISLVEAFSRAITDKFYFNRQVVVSSVCVLGFAGSLIFATGTGLYWLDIIDHYINQYGLVLAGILECLVVAWVLKAKVLRNHISAVSDWNLPRLWDFAITFITPGILLVIFISNLINEFQKPYGGYDVKALAILGGSVLAATLLISFILSAPKWDKKKLDYDHFAEEDKLLV